MPIPRHDLSWVSPSLFAFILVALTTMAPMAGAKSDHEPNAHSRIAASVLGERTRARQLTHATAQLAQMETALQTFLAQTTPVEQEESRTELMEAIDQIHGQELLRALIRDQVDTKQRSRWLLAANTALQHPLYDGSASGLNRRFRAARDSLLSLLFDLCSQIGILFS